MKKVIGVTGGVGAGKSCVVDLLKNYYGADVILADKVAAELEEPGGAAYLPLTETFGKEILGADGTLDRKAFSDKIFSDPKALDMVNGIVHPLTIEEIDRRIKASPASIVVVEAAIFPEGVRELCDEIWFVDADEKIRKERLMKDRGYSGQKCDDIMNSQAERDEFLSICTRVIDNGKSLEDMKTQVMEILGDPNDPRKRAAL